MSNPKGKVAYNAVYDHKPRILEDLKDSIRTEVTRIDKETMEKVEANFKERRQKCVNENGSHLRNVVLHTYFLN